MTAMATEKMDIMESSDGIHTAVVTAMEKIEFFSPFCCRCRRSVKEPLLLHPRNMNSQSFLSLRHFKNIDLSTLKL